MGKTAFRLSCLLVRLQLGQPINHFLKVCLVTLQSIRLLWISCSLMSGVKLKGMVQCIYRFTLPTWTAPPTVQFKIKLQIGAIFVLPLCVNGENDHIARFGKSNRRKSGSFHLPVILESHLRRHFVLQITMQPSLSLLLFPLFCWIKPPFCSVSPAAVQCSCSLHWFQKL